MRRFGTSANEIEVFGLMCILMDFLDVETFGNSSFRH